MHCLEANQMLGLTMNEAWPQHVQHAVHYVLQSLALVAGPVHMLRTSV